MNIDGIKSCGIEDIVIPAASHGADLFEIVIVLHHCHKTRDTALHGCLVYDTGIRNPCLRYGGLDIVQHDCDRTSSSDRLIDVLSGQITFHFSFRNDLLIRFRSLRCYNISLILLRFFSLCLFCRFRFGRRFFFSYCIRSASELIRSATSILLLHSSSFCYSPIV